MDDLEKSTALLKEALDELRKGVVLSKDTIDKLTKTVKQLNKDEEAQADQTEDTTKKIKAFKDATKQATEETLRGLQAVRESRDDFRSLNPIIRATGAVMGQASGKVGQAINSFGEALAGIGAFVPRFGKIISGIGLGVSFVGDMISKHGKDVADAATQFMQFSTAEMQRVLGAFQELGNVGGITAGSIKQLQVDATTAGLSMDQYAKLISRNADGLAAVGGTVTEGSRAMLRIVEASKPFEEQFLKLGLSFEQQREFTAKFLSFNRNVSKIALDDAEALSRANKQYIEQLDETARLTGKSRDKVAAEMEAASREIRFGASLALGERMGGGGTAMRMKQVADVLETQGSKALSEGFKDIFGGATTQRAKQLEIATGGAASGIARALQRGEISTDEALDRLQKAISKQYKLIGGEQTEQNIGKLNTVIEEVLPGMRLVTNSTKMNAESLKAAKTEQEEAAKATGKEVNETVKAQIALRDFAVQLDKIVLEKLFPTMAASVKTFTQVMLDGAELIAKVLGIPTAGGGTPVSKFNPSTSFNEAQRQRKEQQRDQPPSSLPRPKGQDVPLVPPAPGVDLNRFGPQPADALNKLNIKGPESTAGGPADPKLIRMAEEIQKMYPTARFTALNDLYHQRNNPNSKHTQGKALDFTVSPPPQNAGESAAVKQQLAGMGFSKVLDEYFVDKNRYTRGGHFHAELQYGGIVSGPRSGYASLLHGTEAVIPLAGGRSIPIEMNSMTSQMGEQLHAMNEQLSRLDAMVALMQTNTDISRNILRAATA